MKSIKIIFIAIAFAVAVSSQAVFAADDNPLADITDDLETTPSLRGPFFNTNQETVRDLSRLIHRNDNAFLEDIQDLRREVLSLSGQ